MREDGFVVFTRQEGGEYEIRRATRSMFDDTVRDGEMVDPWNGMVGIPFRPAYVAWLRLEDDFDFVLGRKRDS